MERGVRRRMQEVTVKDGGLVEANRLHFYSSAKGQSSKIGSCSCRIKARVSSFDSA